MRRYIIHYSLIVLLIGIVALPTVRANAMGTASLNELEEFANAVMSLSQGQTLRISVLNPNEPGSRGGREPVHMKVKLYDAHSNVIAESDEVAIPANEFRSIGFSRSDISLPGEEGTGRLQVRAACSARMPVRGKKIDEFTASLEIIDNITGMTTAHHILIDNVTDVFERGAGVSGGSGNDTLKSGFGNDFLIGITPDQTLRFTVFNPGEPGSRGGGITKFGSKLLVIQADGNTIAESDELEIPQANFAPSM